MKKIFFQGLVVTLFLWSAVSCQKESPLLSEEINEETSTLIQDLKVGCGLTTYDYYSSADDSHTITNYSYENGLLNEVLTFYGQRYVMEYSLQKKLIASKVYEGENLLYTISFMYEKNRIVKEVWLDATTQEIYDEKIFTYDQKGNLIRSESFIMEAAVVNTYSENGSLLSWQLFDFGLPTVKAEYTYDSNYKNPYNSIKGVDYQFWYTNSAFGFGTGNRWYSSEKVTLYDNNSEPVILYEQDPAKTVWQIGKQHYPLQANYSLKGSDDFVLNTFSYENCDSNKPAKINHSNKNYKKDKKGKNNSKHPFQNQVSELRELK
jgi:hypothetical protein